MSEERFHLENAPIIEAIVDIDCELPPDFELEANMSAIHAELEDAYPKVRRHMVQEHLLSTQEDTSPEWSVSPELAALRFQSADEKQLVQFRTGGFSFNRLAPYEGLDSYLCEIRRTWGIFLDLVKPVQIRKISLRTINQVRLPRERGSLPLEDYLKTGPRLPDECGLHFTGFLSQHRALEPNNQNYVDIVLATQKSDEKSLPLILDINAFHPCQESPPPWETISEWIASLRELKNSVFRNTLTEKCLKLF